MFAASAVAPEGAAAAPPAAGSPLLLQVGSYCPLKLKRAWDLRYNSQVSQDTETFVILRKSEFFKECSVKPVRPSFQIFLSFPSSTRVRSFASMYRPTAVAETVCMRADECKGAGHRSPEDSLCAPRCRGFRIRRHWAGHLPGGSLSPLNTLQAGVPAHYAVTCPGLIGQRRSSHSLEPLLEFQWNPAQLALKAGAGQNIHSEYLPR